MAALEAGAKNRTVLDADNQLNYAAVHDKTQLPMLNIIKGIVGILFFICGVLQVSTAAYLMTRNFPDADFIGIASLLITTAIGSMHTGALAVRSCIISLKKKRR